MKNGFYLELDELNKENEAGFGFLENIVLYDSENWKERVNAFHFLHGWCSRFAMALSETYGYAIEIVRHQEDGEQGKLIHAYCVTEINGQTAYIDVRGITTDADLFFEEFENEVTYSNGELYDYDDYVLVSRYNSLEEYIADGYDETDYLEEAKSCITQFKNYYDMNAFLKDFGRYTKVVLLTEKDTAQVETIDDLSGNSVSEWLLDNEDFAWGLFQGNELIGYCTIGGADELYNDFEQSGEEIYPGLTNNSLLLSDVYIKPEYRGNNNASFMVNEVLQKVAEKYGELVFAVILDPKLSRLYSKFGFENIDEYTMVNPNYYREKPKVINLMNTNKKLSLNATINNAANRKETADNSRIKEKTEFEL